FANQFVNDHAPVRIRISAALAPTALLGGTGLVIDQHRDAGNLRELRLYLVEVVTMMDREAFRPVLVAVVLAWLIGDNHDALGAFGGDLARNHRYVEAAIIGLAAGHRDRVVVEDLVGDVDARGDRSADRLVAGMVIGAVAGVLEPVGALGERRLADPIGALAAHLREARRRAVHPLHHVVAADAGVGARARRHHGRGVVRAAGAEVGNAGRDFGDLRELALRLLEASNLGRDLLVVAGG